MIEGMHYTVTGVELKALLVKKVERLYKRLKIQEAAKAVADETAEDINYDISATSNNKAFSVRSLQQELATTQWKAEHIDTSEVYLLTESDLSWGDLL